MDISKYINIEDVRKTLEILKPNDELFECRILGSDKRKVLSGYFTSADVLLDALQTVDLRKANIYITLNTLNEAVYSREQHDRFVMNAQSTNDNEVTAYEWLFIDLDPTRPAGISSSEEEFKKAKELAEKVKYELVWKGFHEPVEAISGNGYHLLFKVNLQKNEENIQKVKDFLNKLSGEFSNDFVKIDVANYNPSRICKFHGTLAQKGANTKERPYRFSKIVKVPEALQEVTAEMLDRYIGKQEEKANCQPKPTSQQFDLEDFMQKNGITYRTGAATDSVMYMLDECPFDSSHRNGDAKIFHYTNGAISFKCHHNSCAGRKWEDVRKLFDPTAYDRQTDTHIEDGYKKYKAEKQEDIPLSEEPKKEKKKRKLKTATDLMKKELPEPRVFVGVGEELPLLVEGTCILSAKPKLGKSWFVLSMCLAISTGDDFLGYKTRKCSTLYLDLETSEQLQQKRIKKALADRNLPTNFYLDTDTDSLDNGFVEQIEDYIQQDPNIGVVVIDVFQMIRSKAKTMKETEYEHVYRDITPLNELAQRLHIAIILVCHDRKMVDPDDPFSNILGSTGLQGAATQMIVMFNKKKTKAIHISIKGKTIDGLPEIDVSLDEGQWSIVDDVAEFDEEKAQAQQEYYASNIRKAVVAIAEHNPWRGRCSQIINDALSLNVALTETPKEIGGFLHRHQARFLAEDQVQILIVDNGSGPKIYKITKSPLITIDDSTGTTIDEMLKVNEYAGIDIPFF